MIITQKVMRNVSLTAHPHGCVAYVQEQIAFLDEKKRENPKESFPKRVLIIGGSTGYGLSSRLVAAIIGNADTINVSFEREPTEQKTATPGWYNSQACEEELRKRGLYATSIYGDAFSQEIKERVAQTIQEQLGSIDLVIYSLASPMRTDPVTQEVYRSVLKPIGTPYSALSVQTDSGIIHRVTLEPAEPRQIEETIKVMGGEDWQLWISYLLERGLLATGAKTVAYSYIGPEITFPMYREGTIGKAKVDLEAKAKQITTSLAKIAGVAYVSVNKALVTRASAVIPVVPLYIALLYDVMKEKGIHEECIHQMYRLFNDRLYAKDDVLVDEEGRIRLDDWEMREDVQAEVSRRWQLQQEGQPIVKGDLEGFKLEYDHIHGFSFPQIDYTKDVDPRSIEIS